MISTKDHPSTRPTDPKTVAEVYVGWCPNSPDTPWRRRIRHWRWDVTFYTTESRGGGQFSRTGGSLHNGGFSARLHLGADFGYTLTERGAWRRVRRAIRSYPRQVG